MTLTSNWIFAGGAYEVFAGKDATRGLATFNMSSKRRKQDNEENLKDDYSDLSEKHLENARRWQKLFDSKVWQCNMLPCLDLKYLRFDKSGKYPIVGQIMNKALRLATTQTSPPSTKSLLKMPTGSAATSEIEINQVAIHLQSNLETKSPSVAREEKGNLKGATAKSPNNQDERVRAQKSTTSCDLL